MNTFTNQPGVMPGFTYGGKVYMKKTDKIRRGEIYLADLNDSSGSEQSRIRPVIVIQNNVGNKHSPTTIVACLSSKITTKKHLPTHFILPEGNGLKYRSMVLCEQIRVIDKSRLLKKISCVNRRQMNIIDQKIRISLGIKHLHRHRSKV